MLQLAGPLSNVNGPILDPERLPLHQVIGDLWAKSERPGLTSQIVEGSGLFPHFINKLVVEQGLYVNRVIESTDRRLDSILLPNLVSPDRRLEADQLGLELGHIAEGDAFGVAALLKPLHHRLLAHEALVDLFFVHLHVARLLHEIGLLLVAMMILL